MAAEGKRRKAKAANAPAPASAAPGYPIACLPRPRIAPSAFLRVLCGLFLAVLTLSVARAAPLTHPGGLSPGDRYHRIFATSFQTDPSTDETVPPIYPSFGGIPAADWLVTYAAQQAGRVPNWNFVDRTYKAILSDSTVDARDRIVVGGPIYNTADQLIATDSADLWDGSIANPVGYDESGNAIVGSVDTWTGTIQDGRWSLQSAGDWNDPIAASVTHGFADNATSAWVQGSEKSAGQTARLYGFSPLITVPHAADTEAVGTGTSQVVDLEGGSAAVNGMTLTFDDVTTAGDMTLERFDGAAPDEGLQAQLGFGLTGLDGPFLGQPYYDLTFDGDFTGTVQIVLQYDDTGLSPTQEANLRLVHFNATSDQWEDVTTSIDTANNLITATTDGFSPFTLVPEPSTYLLALFGLAALGLSRFRRRRS